MQTQPIANTSTAVMSAHLQPVKPPALLWDIFCLVIDNFGDIGVCWRLCADLAARGHHVRFWVDDASALAWMAPGAQQGKWAGIEVFAWQRSLDAPFVRSLAPADVWVEGFGCDIPAEFLQCFTPPVWINLEYLSAEPYVERAHGLASPVMHGAAKGAVKHFFYPGFTAKTGGLLREPNLQERQLHFDPQAQAAWLRQWGIQAKPGQRLISLFCYEPTALPALLRGLAHKPHPTQLLVTHGRARAAVHAALALDPMQETQNSALTISYLPPLTQTDYDHLLWACDVNFVRGEDSLVRGLWAGKPLVWQIYPQDDAAHHAKLDAFLATIQADPDVFRLHQSWNGLSALPADKVLELPDINIWQQRMQTVAEKLRTLNDLGTELVEFVLKKKLK